MQVIESVEQLEDFIRNSAKIIYADLGAGFEESVYQEAMSIELRRNKINFEIEHNVEILYRQSKVGLQRLDFIVDKKLIVELKAQQNIAKSHEAQTQAYMKTLKIRDALIINFPYPEAGEPQVKSIKI